jgi:hypothetical protein
MLGHWWVDEGIRIEAQSEQILPDILAGRELARSNPIAPQ